MKKAGIFLFVVKKVCFLVFLTYSFFSVEALLPPKYESMKEWQALINDPQLAEKLTTEQMITSINKTDEGFVIVTNRCTIHVDVQYAHQSQPGPAKFNLVFHDPVCKPE